MTGADRVRRLVRRTVPADHRLRIATALRGAAIACSRSTAGVLRALLALLPDAVLLELRERLALRRRLDYGSRPVTLGISSQAERTLRLRSCRKEPETVEWIETTIGAGDVLYDVGANVGAYALIAAARMQPGSFVYAFEPGYRTYASLIDNVLENRLGGRVFAFQVALADTTGLVDFVYGSTEAGAAQHPGLEAGDTNGAARQPVLVYRLDEFVRLFGLRRPTHLKIDVDGGELRVLRGAGSLLDDDTLRWLLVEVEEGRGDPPAVRALLSERGFVLDRDVGHPGGRVHNWIFRREEDRGGGRIASRPSVGETEA